MYLNYEKLKPLKFELNEAETDYFINLYNNTIKNIQKEKDELNWFQKLFRKNNQIDFNKVKDSNLSIEILNKYMKKNKDIIFDKSRFSKIHIGTVNDNNYESCLDSSLLCHKLLVIVKNTRPIIMDTEVLFSQDDGTIFKERHYFDIGDAILLRPHNVITPIYGEVETESDEEDEEDESESVSDGDESESKEEFVDTYIEEKADEDNINKFSKNTVRYIVIDITDKEGGFKMDRRYFH